MDETELAQLLEIYQTLIRNLELFRKYHLDRTDWQRADQSR